VNQPPILPIAASREPVLLDVRFASDELPWQRSLRWTEGPQDRRAVLLGISFACLVLLLQLVGGAAVLRRQGLIAPVAQALDVRWLDASSQAYPVPPDPEPPPPPDRHVTRAHRTAPAGLKLAPSISSPPSDASSESAAAASAPDQLQLFDADGSIHLVNKRSGTDSSERIGNPQERAKARWAAIADRGNPLDCHKTRFAEAFAPDEDSGDQVARKYLKWIGLADMAAIRHRRAQRAESGGCEPSP